MLDLKNIGSLKSFFRSILKKFKFSFLFLVACNVISFLIGCNVINVLLEKITVSAIAMNFGWNNGLLFWITITFVICNLFRYSLFLMIDFFNGKILPEVYAMISFDLFKHSQTISLKDFYIKTEGVIIDSINGTTESTALILENLLGFFIPQIFSIFFVILVFLFNSLILGMVAAIYTIIYVFLFYKMSKKTSFLFKEKYKYLGLKNSFMYDSFKNTLIKKIFNLENFENHKFFNKQKSETDYDKKALNNIAKNNIILFSLASLYYIFFFSFIFIFFKNGIINMSRFIALIAINFWLSFCIGWFSRKMDEILRSFSRLKNSLNTIASIKKDKNTGNVKHEVKGHISIRNLTFGYGEKTVFNNFSMEIPINSKVVFMGESGCGKSTILNILGGLIIPPVGTVFIDNVDICHIDHNFLKKESYYITQYNMVFNSTVEDNILLGRNYQSEDIIYAAKKAKLHHIIENLPEKYSSTVGSSGSQFSLGQLQRLCIARTILGINPKINGIFLCDEATSALDIFTAKEVLENIFEISEGKTLLFVDHSLLIAPRVDIVVIIRSPENIVIGSHKELLKNDSIYRKIFSK